MADEQQFITDNGVTIRWGRLWTVVVGGPILAWFFGVVDVLLALADVPIGILSWIASFAGNYITAFLGLFTATIQATWAGAIPFVRSTGPLAFIISIIIALAAFYGFIGVVRRV